MDCKRIGKLFSKKYYYNLYLPNEKIDINIDELKKFIDEYDELTKERILTKHLEDKNKN